VGSTAMPASAYPAASAAHQIQLPDEPPLGFDNPALDEPSAVRSPVEEDESSSPLCGSSQPNPAPADATSSSDDCDDERRGAGLGLPGDPAGVHFPSPPGTSPNVNAGSLPFRRRI
jgi:hypothetical protein